MNLREVFTFFASSSKFYPVYKCVNSIHCPCAGKPSAADLSLGLATAPVLFASEQFPELNRLILRRFSEPRDVETAFRLELQTKVKRRLIITETEKAPTRASS